MGNPVGVEPCEVWSRLNCDWSSAIVPVMWSYEAIQVRSRACVPLILNVELVALKLDEFRGADCLNTCRP